jgi:hypothetical protein
MRREYFGCWNRTFGDWRAIEISSRAILKAMTGGRPKKDQRDFRQTAEVYSDKPSFSSHRNLLHRGRPTDLQLTTLFDWLARKPTNNRQLFVATSGEGAISAQVLAT